MIKISSLARFGTHLIDMGAMYGDANVAKYVTSANSRRVDLVGIGDSNQLFSGHGWDHGWQYALTGFAPMYATGLVSPGENLGNGSGTGYGFNVTGGGVFTTSSPYDTIFAEIAAHCSMHGVQLPRPVPAGQSINYSGATGPSLFTGALTAFSGNVRFQQEYAVSPNWSAGQHRMAVRKGATPYTSLAASTLKNHGGVEVAVLTEEVIVNATTNGNVLQSGHSQAAGYALAGPAAILHTRAIMEAQSSGFSHHTMVYYGGASLRRYAVDVILPAPVLWTDRYFGKIRSEQSGSKKTVFIINGGLNDRNDSLGSVGPNPAVSSSKAGYKDNMTAIINDLESRWTRNWILDEVMFLLMPSHPVSDPDDSMLVSYVEACKEISQERRRVLTLDLRKITTSAEMLSNGWYQSSGADRNHLTQAGYENLATRALNQLRSV